MSDISIRDGTMSFKQQELALIDGPYGMVTCMQRGVDVEGMYRPGCVVFRTAGGFLDEETLKTEEMEAALRGLRNWVVLSHEKCGAAKVVEEAIGNRDAVPEEVYEAIVDPLKRHDCCTRADVEMKIAGIVAGAIQKRCGELGIEKRNIIEGHLDFPKLLDDSHEGLRLVITSPLRCSYGELGVDPSDTKTYYLHNNLYATQPDIWIAVKKVGVGSIQVRSQNAGEDAEVAKFAKYLKADPRFSMLGAKIEEPVLVRDRIANIYMPPSTREPSPSPRARARL